jgi:hypothetical protein
VYRYLSTSFVTIFSFPSYRQQELESLRAQVQAETDAGELFLQ